MPAKPKQNAPSQSTRRVKFALNVTVAVLAAVGIAVLINWIAYREYKRFDFTATRQYSLSPQTQSVLASLEHGYKITTLLDATQADPTTATYLEKVRDLTDEYARYSSHLAVEHINPEVQSARTEAFQLQVLSQYEQQLQPMVAAIDLGRDALKQAAAAMSGMLQSLKQIASDQSLTDESLRKFVESVAAAFKRNETALIDVDKQIEQALQQALPRYTAAKTDLQSLLQQLDESAFAIAADRFKKAADAPATPTAIKNELLELVEQLQRTREQTSKALNELRLVEPVESYDEVRTALSSTQTVVVTGPQQVRVIPINDMFREAPPEVIRQTGQPDPRFLGEEKLTGTLVSMSLQQPPLVVFILNGQGSAVGPRGSYQHVAQRLRSTNIDVQEWNPAGQMSTFGQPTPPAPPPQPKPGQKAVWIVLPFPPMNPMNPMAAAGGAKEQVAQIITNRAAQGDAVLFILSADPGSRFGQSDPIADYLQNTWGIAPQLDRILLQELQLPDRQTRASNQIEAAHWPQDLSVSQALTGMQGLFLQTSPLVLSPNDPDVSRYPLAELRGNRLWAQRDFDNPQGLEKAKFNQAESAPSFLVAAAAEKENQRIIVVADPVWATDTVTTYGYFGAGTAELLGARFPGNSELFVNSIYWLAHLDELIAASPRSQDIRRINPMTDTALIAYRWGLLAGMPAVVMILGIGVWLVRRQS
jgi:hypothetical protein